MNEVNKTLYIPLYGKACVSRKGLFLHDPKAEEIWDAEGFVLKGKSKSKWLAYYMGIRAAVFDNWVKKQENRFENAIVIHIGCGMDSRVLRTDMQNHKWYDVDFLEVIRERRRYYTESENYRMVEGDIRNDDWLNTVSSADSAIVIMEGVSMYVSSKELHALFKVLSTRFKHVSLLMDCYTVLAAKMSKYKNPINDVGVTQVYGIDDPKSLENGTLCFVEEHEMTPQVYIDQLHGIEKRIFEKLYAGNFSKKLYRLFEYETK